MRIAFATETYLPHASGVVSTLQTLSQALAARGHTVAIFAPSIDRFARIEQEGRVQIYRIPSVNNPFNKQTRITIVQYPLIKDAIKDFKPDIAHLQTPWGIPSDIARLSKRYGYPVVATHHFSLDLLEPYISPLAVLKPLTKKVIVQYLNRVYKKCDFITCPSNNTREHMQKNGLKTPLRVLSNGINTDIYKPGKPEQPQIILHVGRIDKEKNIDLMAEVMQEIIAKHNIHFICIGKGNMLEEFRTKLSAWHDKVDFLGSLPPKDPLLMRAYKTSSLFIVTSLVETQCMVALEAMSSGIPVVGSRAGALIDTVKDKKTGFLPEPTKEEFVAAIEKLLEDNTLREEMGTAARKHVVQEHDHEHVVDTLENWYQESIQKFRTHS